MIDSFRDLHKTLEEEIKYHDSVLLHKKNLEATLWGLEEQSQMPDNSSKEDQTELNIQMNHCRRKIINCNQLLASHLKKLKDVISESTNDKKNCGSCL